MVLFLLHWLSSVRRRMVLFWFFLEEMFWTPPGSGSAQGPYEVLGIMQLSGTLGQCPILLVSLALSLLFWLLPLIIIEFFLILWLKEKKLVVPFSFFTSPLKLIGTFSTTGLPVLLHFIEFSWHWNARMDVDIDWARPKGTLEWSHCTRGLVVRPNCGSSGTQFLEILVPLIPTKSVNCITLSNISCGIMIASWCVTFH